MNSELPPLQHMVFNLLQTYDDMSKTTYRELGSLLGDKHPYSVQQAVEALIRKGFLVRNEITKEITIPGGRGATNKVPFLNIPVLGGVSCGVAMDLGYDSPDAVITVTPSVVSIKNPEIAFALVANGDSMTRASIKGKSVESGDYVIVEKASYADIKDGDYVVTRYNDMFNLKRMIVDSKNRRFILLSESDIDLPPIIVAEEDSQYFEVEGRAVDVIKGLFTTGSDRV